MARTPTTPAAAQATANAHAQACLVASRTILSAIDGTYSGSDPSAAILEAAKTLEAAGCYVRRAEGKGLLVP